VSKQFQRTIEDFVCENCGFAVKGNGYTNHCPKCLWSKHVDINPGDRAEECGGLMKPVGVIKKGETYSVNQQCQKCGFERQNKILPEDDFDKLVEITKGK
jgi:predicted Zn-ribbon and HTH transcriptional regulator